MVVGGENGVVKVLNATLGDDFGKQVMSLETQARYTMRTIYVRSLFFPSHHGAAAPFGLNGADDRWYATEP